MVSMLIRGSIGGKRGSATAVSNWYYTLEVRYRSEECNVVPSVDTIDWYTLDPIWNTRISQKQFNSLRNQENSRFKEGLTKTKEEYVSFFLSHGGQSIILSRASLFDPTAIITRRFR